MNASPQTRPLAALAADLPEEAQVVLRQLDALLDHLPVESIAEIEQRLVLTRQQVITLGEQLQRQQVISTLALQIALKLRTQRDAHAANYHRLVHALDNGDQNHPRVAAFVDTFMAVDTEGILGNLEQALHDPDAASVLVDLAMGKDDIDPDAIDDVIAALVALRARVE